MSAELAEALAANGIDVPIEVVPNGLPLDDPGLRGGGWRVAHGLAHGWGDEPMLVTGGRLHFFKGQNQAVDAFAQVAAATRLLGWSFSATRAGSATRWRPVRQTSA